LTLGVSSAAAYGCHQWNETRKNIASAIEQENTLYAEEKRQQLEEIIYEIKTPEEAFARINMDVAFSKGSDIRLYGADKWSSMLETYSTKKGDCEDGAIAFAAMLSDNPEYEVKLVYLKRDPILKEADHMLAVYREKRLEKWGYASFNEITDEPNVSVMENPLYGSLDSAVKSYCNETFVSYQILDFTAEDLKFGTDITGRFGSSEAVIIR
jgi:hypothetical protein